MRFSSRLSSCLCAILLLAAAALATSATAQTPQALPGIVVQGATLDVPRPAKQPVEPEPDPTPPRPRKQSTPDAAPATPAAASAAAASADGGNAAVTTGSGGSGDVAGVAADKIGTSVSVITGEQMRQQNIHTAVDALRSLPGVSVSRQGGPQNLTVVRIRGAESRHTLVRIDGVEVNSGTDGIFDFSNLVADDIEQIEVLRGPQSGLYGSSALAGVINIITKSGKGPLTLRAQAEVGSLGTRSGAISVSGGNDRAHGILSVYGRTSNGFNISQTGSEDDFADFRNFSFNGGFKLTDNIKIDGSLRRSVTRGGRDDGFAGEKNGFSVPADDNSLFETELWTGRLQATLDTMDGRWVHKAFINRAHTNAQDTTKPLSSVTSFTETISQNTKYGYTSTYRLDAASGTPVRHFVTGLIERQDETFQQPTNPLGFLRERSRVSGAGEIRGEYFNSLFLSATARRDNNEVFDDFTTWRTSAAYKIPSTPFRLHTSYGTGVKYPSFGEQFGFFVGFAPNPNLKPETSRGWDAGIETQLFGGRGVVDITYFNQDLKNEIDVREIPNTFLLTPFNRTGASTREGIEIAGRYLVIPGLTFGAAYTLLNAKEDDGTEEVRRPKHSGRMDVNYGFDNNRANLNIAAIYNGQTKDFGFPVDFSPRQLVPLKEYWLLSASASYKIQPGVEVYGKVENALNQKYEEVFGYDTPGTTVYAGVRLTFEDKNSLSFSKKD